MAKFKSFRHAVILVGNKWITYALLIVIVLGTVSCHSDYLTIDYKTHPGAVWNKDSTYVAFVASTLAYRSAIGISRFPDGGTPKYLVGKMGLYIYDLSSGKLSQIASFDDLAKCLGSTPTLWHFDIAMADTAIFYHARPVTSWEYYAEHSTSIDTVVLFDLRDKYNKSIMYTFDDIVSTDAIVDYKHQPKLGLTLLNKMLKTVPLAEWGLNVKEIYPKSDSEYIEETIYLFNNSATTRRAVVEQIIANKGPMEIERILQKMEDYKNSLSGVEKKEYEIYSKETYEQIKSLL
ncbi:MAG: hypothetical protein KDC58_00050 [Cyclobacteriaceae bacterium]|nr:hypothetical protein [Cyclobacteriaceae bacterium]